MKVLLFVPVDEYIDNIDNCNSFNSVMAFFLKKHFVKNDVECEIVAAKDSFTIKRVSKSNFNTFNDITSNTINLDDFDCIIVLGIKALRNCDGRIIEKLKNFKGAVFQVDETPKRRDENFITLHLINGDEFYNSKYIGQGVDLDYLYSDKSETTLVIHIDHPWPTRAEYFDIIHKRVLELTDSEIYKKHGFETVKFMFHTQTINAIDDIFSVQPTNVPFSELSEIYRKVHIGFISHAETMGNYPLELAATGAIVVLPNKSSVPPAVMDQISYVDIDRIDFWDYIFNNLERLQLENLKKSKNFSYDRVVEKIIKIFNTNMDISNFEEREFDNRMWLWLKDDVGAWRYLTKTKHYHFPLQISEYVNLKGTVVQAGGHAGLYAHLYSSLFTTVHTFEPQPENFYCLNENVKNNNVKKYNVALGESSGKINIARPDSKRVNTGTFAVAGIGEIPMITIDSLNLQECNLIHLDLEGYELFVLKGAKNTINKFKPIIVLETNDACLNYNYTIEDLNFWIETEMRYKILKVLDADTIYAPI